MVAFCDCDFQHRFRVGGTCRIAVPNGNSTIFRTPFERRSKEARRQRPGRSSPISGPGCVGTGPPRPGLEAAVPRLGRESFSASSGLESGSPTNGSATELWLEGVPPPPPRQTKKYVTHTVPDLLVLAGSALSGPESEPHPGPSPAGLPA